MGIGDKGSLPQRMMMFANLWTATRMVTDLAKPIAELPTAEDKVIRLRIEIDPDFTHFQTANPQILMEKKGHVRTESNRI